MASPVPEHLGVQITLRFTSRWAATVLMAFVTVYVKRSWEVSFL